MNKFFIACLLCYSISISSSDASDTSLSQPKITMYERFRKLPDPLQDIIVSYLEPTNLKEIDKKFLEALNDYFALHDPEFIKQTLRTEYFLRKHRKQQFSQPLLKQSSLCNLKKNKGEFVLHRAAQNENSEIVALAVACGAEIDAKVGNLKLTALYYAASKGAFGICKFLLHHGASGKIYIESCTPLYYAIKYDSVKAVIMFQDAGIILAEHKSKREKDKSLMYTAANVNAIKVIIFLAQQGKNLNWQDQYGYTPLMRAAVSGHTKAVTTLLSLGADPSVTDSRGETYEPKLNYKKNGFKKLFYDDDWLNS